MTKITLQDFIQFLEKKTDGKIKYQDILELAVQVGKPYESKIPSFYTLDEVNDWIMTQFENENESIIKNLIFLMFVWANTPQGYLFWSNLHDDWMDFCEGKPSKENTHVINLYKWLLDYAGEPLTKEYARSFTKSGLMFPRGEYTKGIAKKILDRDILMNWEGLSHETWKTVKNAWHEYIDSLEAAEIMISWAVEETPETFHMIKEVVQEHKNNKGRTMKKNTEKIKKLALLSRAYYIGSGGRRSAAEAGIRAMMEEITREIDGELYVAQRDLYTFHGGTYFKGNIEYEAVVQEYLNEETPQSIEDMLKILSMFYKGKSGYEAFEWVLPECQKLYEEWLKGGDSTTTLWNSNSKKIKFNAKERLITLKKKKSGLTFTFEISSEQLLGVENDL